MRLAVSRNNLTEGQSGATTSSLSKLDRSEMDIIFEEIAEVTIKTMSNQIGNNNQSQQDGTEVRFEGNYHSGYN